MHAVKAGKPRAELRTRFALILTGIGASLFAACALTIGSLLTPVWNDPTSHFIERKGRLAAVEFQGATRLDAGTIHEARLRSDSGLSVDVAVRVPDGPDLPRPTVLILGGRGTGRDAVRLVGAVDGVTVAAISYPREARMDLHGLRAVLNIAHYQRGVLDTVPSLLLAADFLVVQPYVDPARLELMGVSLGAFFTAPAGALDARFRRIWLVHGAGNPRAVIDYALRNALSSDSLRRGVASGLNVLAGGDYLAAERWVGRIAPRPVIVINARDDERLPRDAVETLHSALGAGHEIVWTSGQHVEPGRADVLEQLRREVLSRVR